MQLVGFLGKMIGNMIGKLGKKVQTRLTGLLAKNIIPQLRTKATLSLIDNFEKKISGKRAVRVGN